MATDMIEHYRQNSNSPSQADPREFLEFPYYRYCVNEDYGFAYCSIDKVANTTLKQWFIQTQGFNWRQWEEFGLGIHEFVRSNFGLRDPERLQDPGLFIVVFVRNPWYRLLSAYLHKFHVQAKICLPIVAQVPNAVNTDITFRQFVTVLEAQPDFSEVDPHWRPQSCYLTPRQPDFIGRFERLAKDVETVSKQLELPPCPLPHRNPSPIVGEAYQGSNLADLRISEIAALGRRVGPKDVYDEELVERVGRLYQQDIQRFGYEFAR